MNTQDMTLAAGEDNFKDAATPDTHVLRREMTRADWEKLVVAAGASAKLIGHRTTKLRLWLTNAAGWSEVRQTKRGGLPVLLVDDDSGDPPELANDLAGAVGRAVARLRRRAERRVLRHRQDLATAEAALMACGGPTPAPTPARLFAHASQIQTALDDARREVRAARDVDDVRNVLGYLIDAVSLLNEKPQ